MELLVDTHSIYMKIWNFNKIFIRKTIIFSLRVISVLIKLIKIFLKYALKYILVSIFKKIPLGIRKKIINLIYEFPKLFLLIKKFRSWIIKTDNLNQVLETQFIVCFFIRNVLLPIFRISLENSYLRSIILNEIRLNILIKTELNKLLKELNSSKEVKATTFLLYKNKNSELSDGQEEIYRDLRIFSTET